MFYYPYYYTPHDRAYYAFRPEYPDVDIEMFEQSVDTFKLIADESIMILNQLKNYDFAKALMNAAQNGNQAEVDRLIQSIGITQPVTAKYTPTGIFITINSASPVESCCSMTMYLKWGG